MSSTGAELAAGLLAVSSDVPIHQATDSRAYQVKAQRILDGHNLTFKKPWSLMRDGDLWELFELACKRRGGKATTTISWCKGHAVQADIDRGTSNLYLQWGNNLADLAADRGMLEQSIGLDIASFFQSKQNSYVSFVHEIHKMIINVLKGEKALRDELSRKQAVHDFVKGVVGGKKLITINTARLCVPPCSEGFHVGGMHPSLDDMLPHDATNFWRIWRFIRLSTWKPAPSDQNGSSWIELYARFQAMGGYIVQSNASISSIAPKHVFSRQVTDFKVLMRRVIAITLDPVEQQLFKPSRCANRRLRMF